jgi:type IV secretory pathway VirB6-like protein
MKFLYLFFFLLSLSATNDCYGRSLISSSSCIIGHQTEKSNILTVKTVTEKCYTNCNQYCLSKFNLDSDNNSNSLSQDQETIIMSSNVFNVNKDKLDSCLSQCYNGKPSKTEIRIPIKIDSSSGSSIDDDGTLPYQWKCHTDARAKSLKELSCSNKQNDDTEPDVASLCSSDELTASFYRSQLSFKSGDIIKIALANNRENSSTSQNSTPIITTPDNVIYLCGFKTVFFSPEYFIGSKGYKGDQKYHTDRIFSPRNNSEINTGIKVKENDYLKIQYMGRYNPSGKLDYPSSDDEKEKYHKLEIKIGDSITYQVPPYQINDYDDANKKKASEKCEPCNQSSSDPICQTPSCGFYQPGTNKHNLSVITLWNNIPSLFNSQQDITKTYSQFRTTTISGNITNIKSSPHDLIISYPQSSNKSQGGYFVNIEWRGCRYTDGERIEYAIVNEVLYNSFNFDNYMTSNNGVKWRDLEMKKSTSGITSEIIVNNADLEIPTSSDFGFLNDPEVTGLLPKDKNDYKGRIYFRIKTLSDKEAKSLKVSQHSRADTLGQYSLKVSTVDTDKGLLQSLVYEFVKKLKDISQAIFEGFQSNNHYLTIIRLLLVLYIGLLGLMFMAGIAQINQKEGVIIVFKLSLVIMLLSDSSFEFFNDFFFKAFSFESMNYFANIVIPDIQMDIAPGLNPENEDCFSDAVEVKMLCVLEKDLKLFFMWDFWNRVVGLAFSGFFIGAIAITIGIIMYGIVIVKITALYCVSLLAMTVTLSLSPIFLPFMLFKYTKNFFNAWVKQLISLLLQPLFMFIAITLFRIVFIVLIQGLMGNGSCKLCWIEIFGWCILEIYYPLSLGSSPSFASLPMSNIGILLSLYFVGHGMYSFATEVTSMANRMISFSLFNISSAKVGPKDLYDDAKKFGSMTYGIATAPLDVLSIDDKSMDQRKRMRRERRDKQNK